MKSYFYLFIFLFVAPTVGCKSRKEDLSTNNNCTKNILKDTLNHDDILNDLNSDIEASGFTVKLKSFDLDGKELENIVYENDTFFLQAYYQSKKYQKLSKNHITYLTAVTDNIKVVSRKDNHTFKVCTKPNADTIKFDVAISSSSYKFNSFYLDKNNKIQYYIVDKIGLCTMIEVLNQNARLNSRTRKK